MNSGARLRTTADWVWYADSIGAQTVRTLLTPLSMLFAWGVRLRNARFDAATHYRDAVIPAISVGNLTVGGTGKTPVASWFAARLLERGATPALVLRGYGDDEWRVHQLLTPRVPVVVNRDRVAALASARTGGADCAVLDDAFQHRRAPRVSNVVLISADRFTPLVHVLPAGPYREGLRALTRATAVLITVKAAGDAQIATVEDAIRRVRPDLPVAVVRLVPASIRSAGVSETATGSSGLEHPLEWIREKSLLLTSAIADADAFEMQVVACGGRLVRHLRFPDHHPYTASDVTRLVQEARGSSGVLCTLKDAVKLGPLWPREAVPLWYVSQTLVVDRGAEVLERECDRVLAARAATVPTAG